MCLVLDSNLEDFGVSCKYLVLADAGNPDAKHEAPPQARANA